MPPACSAAVSPAVVWLEPLGEGAARISPSRATQDVALVDQTHLQFRPRVSAITRGGSVRFTNGDSEPHNIHILGRGELFNQSIPPGGTTTFAPRWEGVIRVVCDIHLHMRAFVIVAPSAFVAVCDRNSTFRIAEVPAGRYRLHVWHELGSPLAREVEVTDAKRVDLGSIVVEGPDVAGGGVIAGLAPVAWPDVIDRISTRLAASLEAGRRPEGAANAVSLVGDAYYGEFEASDMEAAVRSYLGQKRTIGIERQFRGLYRDARRMAKGEVTRSAFAGSTRGLLSDLNRAALDLHTKGITDRSKLGAVQATMGGSSGSGSEVDPMDEALDASDIASLIARLRSSFAEIALLAQSEGPEVASNALGDAYFDAFEPIEMHLFTVHPGAVRPLEMRFHSLRGRIAAGLGGDSLRQELASLHGDVEEAVKASPQNELGALGVSFAAAFGTLLREGVEVILLLSMLLGLAARSGEGRTRARRAIAGGFGLAVVASVATAMALGQFVASSRGRTSEMVEGLVMLAASGVLFYVSYWLISQVETKRWLEFLKRSATGGNGALLTFGITTFLAVYREGAEIVLMYQALAANQTPTGLAGIVLGSVVALLVLGAVAFAVKTLSVRLPMQRFFQVTGVFLFVLAVVFAGQGIFELQMARVLRTTSVSVPFLGEGWPILGLYPSVQGLAVQGILVLAAVASLVILRRRPEIEDTEKRGTKAARERRGVGTQTAEVLTEIRS
jgi:high-affinity iron transporter